MYITTNTIYVKSSWTFLGEIAKVFIVKTPTIPPLHSGSYLIMCKILATLDVHALSVKLAFSPPSLHSGKLG